MICSLLALFMVLAEIGLSVYGTYVPAYHGFYEFFIYGSPVHLVVGIMSRHTFFIHSGIMMAGMILFHAFKYILLVRSRLEEEWHWSFLPAIVLETGYLAYCGYILY